MFIAKIEKLYHANSRVMYSFEHVNLNRNKSVAYNLIETLFLTQNL